ncbi:MAG TPA: arsenate reductase family protein [Candidatus Evtepia faecigallinarum]|nr:arsenate reductase family protein [Candidatus Evtepia faecigallinarum]
MLFYCYNKCSTCRKAQKWLDEQGISYEKRDIKEDNPTLHQLETYHQASGLPLKKFFNTSGQLYRSLGLSKKLPEMTEAEQYALLASDGLLVKRPLLVKDDGQVLVGFQEEAWAQALGR